MATHETLTSLFSAIADKIRKKTGSTDVIIADNFPDAIDNILTPTDETIATKTSSDLTASGATVTVPAGYYASQATKSVSTATQATPSISISSAGLITTSATQTAGYVSAGTKSATKQLTTQTAKTITPSTSSQTAVSSGVYTTGAVTVKGDTNLKAENIKSGVSIFGVDGGFSGDGNFYETTKTLSKRQSVSITVNGFTPQGIFITSDINSNEANVTNHIVSFFYHSSANYIFESFIRYSNDIQSNQIVRSSQTIGTYYSVTINNSSISIRSLDTDYLFDGDYRIYVF